MVFFRTFRKTMAIPRIVTKVKVSVMIVITVKMNFLRLLLSTHRERTKPGLLPPPLPPQHRRMISLVQRVFPLKRVVVPTKVRFGRHAIPKTVSKRKKRKRGWLKITERKIRILLLMQIRC
jgi:hypothetical protein